LEIPFITKDHGCLDRIPEMSMAGKIVGELGEKT
jgi:hypothetical protein